MRTERVTENGLNKHSIILIIRVGLFSINHYQQQKDSMLLQW